MKSKRVLIVFFAAVLSMTALSLYLSFTVDRAKKDVTFVLSPDGKFKATRTTVTSKTAGCFEDVIVRFAVYPDALQEKRNLYEVYTATCAADRAPPVMEWVSNRELRITYAPPADGKPPNLSPSDITTAVNISFVARGR